VTANPNEVGRCEEIWGAKHTLEPVNSSLPIEAAAAVRAVLELKNVVFVFVWEKKKSARKKKRRAKRTTIPCTAVAE